VFVCSRTTWGRLDVIEVKVYRKLLLSRWEILVDARHRGLRLPQDDDGNDVHRTPAMAAKLAERPLKVVDILTTQVVGFVPRLPATLEDFKMRLPRATSP